MLSLKLITEVVPDEVRLLAKWRKKVQPLWGETFKVTYKGTTKWLKGIIANPRKMLFFIVKNNKLIGHVGFDDIDLVSCFIGNVIRGEGRSDGSMGKAIKLLMRMAKRFNKPFISLQVLTDREDAIKFYKKLGFKFYKGEGRFSLMKYED